MMDGMGVSEGNEEEVFAVLCVYSQLLCVGAMWCWRIY